MGGILIFTMIFFVLSGQRDNSSDTRTQTPPAIQSATDSDTTAQTEAEFPSQVPASDGLGEQTVDLSWRDKVELATPDLTGSVDELLLLGDKALEDGRLYEPDDNHALQYYSDVLSIDPSNEQALEGIHALAVALARTLMAHLDQREISDAAQLYPRLRLLEDTAEIRALGDRIESIKQAQQQMEQANGLLQSLELSLDQARRVRNNLIAVTRLDPDHPGLDKTRRQFQQRLVRTAIALAESDEFVSSQLMLHLGKFDQPSELLQQANQRRLAIRSSRSEQLYLQFEDSLKRLDYAQASGLIAQMESWETGADRINQLRERVAHHRLYGDYSVGQRFSDPLGSEMFGPEMAVIPVGEFTMGNSKNRRSPAYPAHVVRFSVGFAMAIHETSVFEFQRFVEATAYVTDAEKLGFSYIYDYRNGALTRKNRINWRYGYEGTRAEPEDPVIHVSWNDARAYINWLNQRTSQRYRLPSEAEFEYVLRAGSTTSYWWGEGSPKLLIENLTGEGDLSPRKRSWTQAFDDYEDGYWGVAPVGTFMANPMGVKDMAGNVEEWVEDCWHDSYVRAPSDGSAWVNRGCEQRVIRGSYWGGSPEKSQSDFRAPLRMNARGATVGIRVVRELIRDRLL